MPHADWRPVAHELKARLGRATSEQLGLGRHVGVKLGPKTPKILAAALLRDRLGEALGRPESPPSYTQIEILEELDAHAVRGYREPRTRAIASAWIDILYTRRTLEWLTALKPGAGDIAVEWRHTERRTDPAEAPPERFRIVSSIGDDGMVYFRGGGGRRARVHRIDILYRTSDDSPAAVQARANAEREAARRIAAIDSIDGLSSARARRLIEWRIPNRGITAKDADALRGVIETAKDERPLQDFLERYPHIWHVLLTGAHGQWARPQLRLGDRYVADFFIADADSSGIRWRLVELESPLANPITKGGEWRKEARHAIHQISEWRHYIAEHPDGARKDREHEGLGLVDIEAGVPGLILIGRRSLVAGAPAWMRRALALDSAVEMHTYDWLLERVDAAVSPGFGDVRGLG